jgi:Icc-related predicted phosphoesterase
MKIKVVSDLHLEFSDVNIVNNGADVLILSGDIMIAEDLHDHPEPASAIERAMIANGQGLGRRQEKAQMFRDFLKRVSFQFPHVIYVAGNHEFYHGKWVAALNYLRDECAKFPNVHFFENDTKIIDGVVFVGATLWTDMNQNDSLTKFNINEMMNDFRVIRHDKLNFRRVNPDDCIQRHKNSLKYLAEVLDQHKTDTCVVVTHMAPTFKSIGPKYVKETIMNGGFASNLSEFILDRPQIKLWTHGHVHSPSDYMVGSTRVVCNPRGYETYEGTQWDPTLLVEV